MNLRWVRLSRRYRLKQLRRHQRLVSIKALGTEHLQAARSREQGVMITPNHSVHYDSAALYVAADQIDQPLYFMTAWQVFAMSKRFECWMMQQLGCFSIDRESNDRKAFKQSIDILRNEPHPLVIFPEGDIYHTSDRVTPFREGAAAIAHSAAKRADREIVVVPCGIKFWYIDDPREALERTMSELEQSLLLRSQPHAPLPQRIYRLAEALVAIKEVDYLGSSQAGTLAERIARLSDHILTMLEQRHELSVGVGAPPDRSKLVRRALIAKLEAADVDRHSKAYAQLQHDMEDIFFVMQLYSYPGDYLRSEPSVERLAETIDKFEEDILGRELPTVRGRRKAAVQFGEPITVDPNARGREGIAQLTGRMQTNVQEMLDGLSGGSSRVRLES